MAVFYNYATLSYNQNVTNSNVVTGELVEVITVTKNAVASGYRAGDTITYVVNVINSGNSAYNNLTLTDNLGAYPIGGTSRVPLTYIDGSVQYYVNGVLQAAPVVSASGTALTVSGINVPADSNVAIIYRVNVNEFAPLAAGSTITNTASISGTGITTVTATETLPVLEEAFLTISKALNPTTVVENEPLTYTFVISNTGNTAAVAADNVVLTDTFAPALDIISVTYNGTAWASPANYTYDPATGVFSTVAGQITVPAAVYTTDPATGAVSVTPGTTVITVTGTI
ncbi:MAG: hypothetical protein IJY04_07710 [Clostridia bacterium]|nr:hypothetical protein [Clostridia bacterium]